MRDRILVVDDDESVTSFLSVALIQEGFLCQTANSASEALSIVRKSSQKPINLIITDMIMPVMNGIELIEQLQRNFLGIGVVVISADKNLGLAIEAMKKGALDFITKPFQIEMVLPRIYKALERIRLERENRDYQEYLEEKVENRTAALIEKHRSLQKLFINTVEAIARAIEAKDSYTVGHSKRVSKYCARIAQKMGREPEETHDIEVAGLLHDVGKIGIPDAILGKPTKLSIEEYESIKEHPLISLKIIEPIQELGKVRDYVKYHHEKWDGTGYPEGLRGEDIPLGARILSVADAFDTMWIGRQYHAAWNLKSVIKEFQKNRDTQFDGKVVDAFVELIHEDKVSFERIRKENPPSFKILESPSPGSPADKIKNN